MKAFWSLTTNPLKSKIPPKYTVESVRRCFQEEPDSAQAKEVRWQLERISSYMHDPKLRSKYKGLETYHSRLPSILSMYLRGWSVEQIADYYKPVYTTYGIERSLHLLSEHIAERLNKDR